MQRWRAGTKRALLNVAMALCACGGRSMAGNGEAELPGAAGHGAAGASGFSASSIGGASGGGRAGTSGDAAAPSLGGSPATSGDAATPAVGGRTGTNGDGATPSVGPSAGSGSAAAGGIPTRECGSLIDDLDDGTGWICHGDGRVGAWYAYNDGFGVQIPAVEPPGTPILPSAGGVTTNGGREGAMYSFHSYPNPADLQSDAWGAGIGLDLNFDGVVRGVYDASGFTGITFWVRSNLSSSVLVRLNTDTTTPAEYGGSCATEFCGTWSISIGVGAKWEQVTLPFSTFLFWPIDVEQPPPVPPAFDLHRLTNIQFLFVEFPPDLADRDIWLDDLAFTR